MDPKKAGKQLIEDTIGRRFHALQEKLSYYDDYYNSIPKDQELYWFTLEETKDIFMFFPKEVLLRRFQARKFGHDELYITEEEWEATLTRKNNFNK